MLTIGNTTVVLERPRMCALCATTVAKRGSLCHTCADEIDRQMIDDNAIANFETCSSCAGPLNRHGYCDECMQAAWR